jgi:hypothetical protein
MNENLSVFLAAATVYVCKDLINDLIRGAIVRTRGYYKKGDIIQIGSFVGAVEHLGIVATHLKSMSGERRIVANGLITTVIKKYALCNDLFISYSRKDKDFVERLHYQLKKSGHDAWVDYEDIQSSDYWKEVIIEGIDSSCFFICVLSEDYAISDVCINELEYARIRGKKIIPILRREIIADIPDTIANINWLFFRESDSFEGSFRKLLKIINGIE